MSVRRLLAGVAATSLAATALAVAAPAQADPSFAPTQSDIVGVGSDTTMYAMTYLADGHNGTPGFNAGRSSGRLVSFDANIYDAGGVQTNSTQITLLEGTSPVTRPNGSGNGKKALLDPAYASADYARSSSALSDAEIQAGLQLFPFAKDEMSLATDTTTNAPATITAEQLLGIYSGAIKNWSAIGGANAPIQVMVPQKGSGTFQFFDGELKRLNGGVAVTYPADAVFVQEHDAAPLKGKPNAVAPFSIGRNRVAGSPLRIAGGWLAERAVYNVLRQGDVGRADLQAVFGPSGYLCTAAAKPLIEAAGFAQLLPQAQGGVCGVATQAATTNLATQQVATATTVSATSAAAGSATLTATVTGARTPSGRIDFFLDGAATPSGSVPLTAGKAVRTVTGLSAGVHSVVARFVPAASSVFTASESARGAFTVLGTTPAPAPTAKASTKLAETFKAKYARGAVVKGKVKVKESATGAATGKVVIKLGKKIVGKGKVKNGVAVIKLTKPLKKGKNKLVAQYAGDAAFAASRLKFVITVKG